jgi:prepilin-type N-terminal cleavage/methylation domain-containing protein
MQMINHHEPNGGNRPARLRAAGGFSLIECVIALLILLIASLAVISVFDYSFRTGQSSRKRAAAVTLAEQRIEDVRNTNFIDLPAGTTTETNVMVEGLPYTVTRTITDTDSLTVATAPGPETKTITVTVTPVGGTVIETVTLTTVRAKNAPGPNRKPNSP